MDTRTRFYISAIETAKLQIDIKNGEYSDDPFRGLANLYECLADQAVAYEAWVRGGSEGLTDLAAKSRHAFEVQERKCASDYAVCDDFAESVKEFVRKIREDADNGIER